MSELSPQAEARDMQQATTRRMPSDAQWTLWQEELGRCNNGRQGRGGTATIPFHRHPGRRSVTRVPRRVDRENGPGALPPANKGKKRAPQ